jgi:hypothetical protein
MRTRLFTLLAFGAASYCRLESPVLGDTVFEYDHWHRLTRVAYDNNGISIAYPYDGSGNRIGRIFKLRGDANGDGVLDISDGISMFGCLFLGGNCPDDDCKRDANGDGKFDISDPISLLSFIFMGGPPPKACL